MKISANLKGKLRKPFLFFKYRNERKKKIKNAFLNQRTIKEIMYKCVALNQELIFEEKQLMRNDEKINKLKGWIECINYIVS